MTGNKTARGVLWGAAAFYALVAFEFFYMAGPFAAYFYSVYGLGLAWLDRIPVLRELTGFFLPHIVSSTNSVFIDLLPFAGAVAVVVGLSAFGVGAWQVYSAKLGRRGAVTSGLYSRLRHPQYTALALSGLGLLLLWPRYLALVLFVTMLFGYALLARIEERECLRRFGDDYREYLGRTLGFIPLPHGWWNRQPEGRPLRPLVWVMAYSLALCLSLGLARGLHLHAVDSVVAVYGSDSANVALERMPAQRLAAALRLAFADARVRHILAAQPADARYLNYIMPLDVNVSELPLAPMQGTVHRHFLAGGSDGSEAVKILLARAETGTAVPVPRRLLLRTCGIQPLAEVWVDPAAGVVLKMLPPSRGTRYGSLPMPLF